MDRIQLESELSTAAWRKSTRSLASNDQCVEVAPLSAGHVALRDSKNPDGPALIFTPGEWAAFADGMTAGEFRF